MLLDNHTKTHITTKTQHDNVIEKNRFDHGKKRKCAKRVQSSIVHTYKAQQKGLHQQRQ